MLRSYLRTPIQAVLVNLLLEWNTNFQFNSGIVNCVWKTDEGGGRGEKAFFC